MYPAWKHMKYTHILFSSQSLDPSKRIGCEEMGGYDPLKQHPFFDTISWSDLHVQTPPKLTPYLPAMSEDDEDCYGNVKLFLNVLDLLQTFFVSAYLWRELSVISCPKTKPWANKSQVILHSIFLSIVSFPSSVWRSPEPVQQHASGPVQLITLLVTTWVHTPTAVQQQHWAVHPWPG